MKYNFDEVVDRIHEPGSYSIKWADNPFVRQFIGAPDPLPENRISYFTADMDFRCPPGVKNALQVVLDHDIFGYSGFDDDYYKAVTGWFKRRFDWEFSEDSIFYAHGTHEGIAQMIRDFTQVGEGVMLFTPSYG
ncbi:MAG: pyridoxal phosphate-dependent aminotransferase, partial [Firmicutes bacterium]|nr:pyridoxal phosphate-dependent aminotransferase [Bacillota bacterium]